jgi:uncharacterized repeat protein (TIGR04076 family)
MGELVVRIVSGPQVGWCVHEAGDFFEVENGAIRIPSGKCVCVLSLSTLLPFISAHQGGTEPLGRKSLVEHVHCPDPEGKVIWKIEVSSQSTPAKTK